MTSADLLTLLIDKAPELRKAGVTELTFDAVHVKLAPWLEEREALPVAPAEPDPLPGSLEDPTIYGLPPGSDIPGFPALRERRRARRDDAE